MAEGPHARSVCSFAGFAGAVAAGGVFAQVMNDGSGSGKGLRMSVEAEAGEFGHPELFAKNAFAVVANSRSEEHTSELESRGHLVCRLLLEKKKQDSATNYSDRIPSQLP